MTQADLLNLYSVPVLLRLRFIDTIAATYGYINRKTVVDYFGVSEPQASLDMTTYRELAPDNLLYDLSLKRYNVSGDFKRLFM